MRSMLVLRLLIILCATGLVVWHDGATPTAGATPTRVAAANSPKKDPASYEEVTAANLVGRRAEVLGSSVGAFVVREANDIVAYTVCRTAKGKFFLWSGEPTITPRG